LKKEIFLIIILFFICGFSVAQKSNSGKLLPPSNGIYAGVFPDMGSTEDSVTSDRIREYINLSGSEPVWVCFSNSWFDGIKFPMFKARIIGAFNAVPYIRIMPRHDWTQGKKDPIYDLKYIINGDFDDEIIQWAKDAKKYGKPLLVEFAPEMNGNWFPWSGAFNGREKGAKLYVEAHRYIVELMKDEKADNITWMFHVNAVSEPDMNWNRMKAYYPGDDYIDWIGMSVYGSQKPGWEWTNFTGVFQKAYWEMEKISKTKPLAIAEFGAVEDPASGSKPDWIKEAFETIIGGYYPRIKAISYWHSSFDNSDGSISNMRIDSSPEVLSVFRDYINREIFKAKPKFEFTN
jgi:hypothetical protein